MKPEIKKLLILNLPYLLFVWLFDKVGAAVRLSPGADASAKLLHLGDGFTAAFSSIAPSFPKWRRHRNRRKKPANVCGCWKSIRKRQNIFIICCGTPVAKWECGI